LTAQCHILEHHDLHTVLHSGMWCIMMRNVSLSLSISVTLSHLMNNPNSEWTLSTLNHLHLLYTETYQKFNITPIFFVLK